MVTLESGEKDNQEVMVDEKEERKYSSTNPKRLIYYYVEKSFKLS
jgi:hypothetical protein